MPRSPLPAPQAVEIDDVMMSAPVMILCQNGLRLSRFVPLFIVVWMNDPMRGPCTEPTAPKRLVPPMTDEAIACNSQPSP